MLHLFQFKRCRLQWLISLALSTMLFVMALPAIAGGTPQQTIQRLDGYIEQAITQAEAKNFKQSAIAFQHYKDAWFDAEDGVKQVSRQSYKDIEDAMGQVKFELSTQPPNQTALLEALKSLHKQNQTFISGGVANETTPKPAGTVTIATLLDHLNRADTAIGAGDIPTAVQAIARFKTDWLEVEGVVATKSRVAYTSIENTMATAAGLLRSNPPQGDAAKSAIATLKQELQPFASETLRYTLFDAAAILLREGLEALLVLVALLAFLTKSGNGDKQRWLWIGAGVGILASIATALIINVVFANIASGANRELVEGGTGLVAAAMLFYVSYWLHSKSSLIAWQGYIHNQINTALATNSLISLALLAFLAVYREGAETTLFYIGIAPSISTTDLLLGLGLGVVALIAIAILMLGLGLQIPLKPFFLVTSLLIYYLGFKFVGAGIHALQVAGILPATPASFLPALESWGLYPTWETTVPQLALLVGAIAIVLYTRQKALRTESEALPME
jgi:high-affinity iron transporter